MASVSGTNVVESSNNSSNNTTTNNNNNLANVPQWKRDLIQRRKQQNKVSTNNNGANTKLCTTTTTASNNGVIANDASNMVKIIDSCTSKHEMTEENMSSSNRIDNNNDTCDLVERSVTSSASCTATTTTTTTRESSSSSSSSTPPLPLTTTSTATTSTTTIITKDTQLNVNESVACKMRFEADVSVCPSSEDTPKTTTTSTTTTLTKSLLLTERNNLQDYNNFDSDYKDNIICHNKNNNNTMDNNKDSGGGGVCVYAEFKKGWDKTTTTTTTGKIDDKIKNQNHHINNNNHHCIIDDNKKIKLIKKNGDECESDSSEELQYGPGIVNRLKSKYLNLTLREMNKSRVSVQRFRRAASLEDLLDCDDHDDDGVDDNDNNNDENDKLTRKFTKKPLIPGIINKTDRYRNATRGNESMKRARSVEALMRCQNHDDTNQNSRFIGVRQEPVNDHIVLVDRATVKIESRLIGNIIDNDRPKALNKPKRIKPLLADTERPPPDLVKTTMRIFEGSVRKLKLKGDVAAKVATFKTINDTYKAQTVKKIVPKPPIQPKPFTNNNNNNININKQPSSPKKNISSQLSKPITAELIENPLIHEEYKNDGVVTDPIVQSVSSVVSKFQQIGKSINSPSSSPEPIYNKLKSSLSPISSPEPPFINNNNHHHQNNNNSNHNNNHHHHKQKINNDAGIGFNKSTSPVTSPSSPKKNLPRQNIILTQSASVSPVHEIFRTNNNSTLESLVKAQPEILISEETVIEETDKQPENRRQQVLEDKILPPIIHDEIIEEEKNEEANKHVKELNEEIINKQDIIEDIIDDVEAIDGPKTISKSALDSISKAGCTMEFNFNTETSIKKSYLPGTMQNGNSSESTQNGNIEELKNNIDKKLLISNDIAGNCGDDDDDDDIKTDKEKINETPIILDNIEIKKNDNEIIKPSIGAISSLGMIKSSSTTMSYSQLNESKLIKNQKTDLPPQKQIGIIRPLVSTKTQLPQQNLSSRELEKNLINRVKSIEQPTKVVVSLKSADEIQPVKKTGSSGSGGGGLWDTKPWNQQNNTMVFNFSNRKDVPDYIENDGLIISRKREKSKVGDGGIIVLDATLDASTTDDNDWDNSEGPPSPCDIKFTNDNILINGRSNLSRSPRNHKHRIQFNDQATRTFEYPSESSMLEDIGSTSCVDGETSGVGDHQQSTQIVNKSISPTVNSASVSPILGGGGLSNFTPSKVDLTSEGFELGVTRTLGISSTSQSTPIRDGNKKINDEEAMNEEEDCLQNSQDTAAWGAEATADLLY